MKFSTRVMAYKNMMVPLIVASCEIYMEFSANRWEYETHCGINARAIFQSLTYKSDVIEHYISSSIDSRYIMLKSNMVFRLGCYDSKDSWGHTLCGAVYEDKYYVLESSFESQIMSIKELSQECFINYFNEYTLQISPTISCYIQMGPILDHEEILENILSQHKDFYSIMTDEENAILEKIQRELMNHQ